jgi:hypothetical protein
VVQGPGQQVLHDLLDIGGRRHFQQLPKVGDVSLLDEDPDRHGLGPAGLDPLSELVVEPLQALVGELSGGVAYRRIGQFVAKQQRTDRVDVSVLGDGDVAEHLVPVLGQSQVIHVPCELLLLDQVLELGCRYGTLVAR